MAPDKHTRPPLDRMLRIHHALKAGGQVNARTLRAELEVSRKTIVRDVAYMRDRLGLPIDFDVPTNTYRYTEPVGAFPTVQVSEREVVGLLIFRKALEQYRGAPFHAQVAASFRKIAAGLKDEVSFNEDAVQDVSFARAGVGRVDAAVLAVATGALAQRVELHFDYRKPGETRPRRRLVRPYHFAERGNLWYLIGFDLKRGALRRFALTRITNPTPTKVTFERPEDFSVEKFFAGALTVLGGDGDHRIVIHFSAAVADRVREREWHESEELRELPGGGLELRLRLTALEEVAAWVLQWGEHARVVEPAALRERMAQTAAALAKEYVRG